MFVIGVITKSIKWPNTWDIGCLFNLGYNVNKIIK